MLWGPHQPPRLRGAAAQAPGPPHQANLHTAWGTWRPMTLTPTDEVQKYGNAISSLCGLMKALIKHQWGKPLKSLFKLPKT